jgi:hypothetical protein
MLKMPAMSFSVFKAKLWHGTKCQTIRRPRKKKLKVGDLLKIYWKQRTPECQFLGTTHITDIVVKNLNEVTEEEAILDGFEADKNRSAAGHLRDWFLNKYGPKRLGGNWTVITFEPIERAE